jgi:hypothetical protein
MPFRRQGIGLEVTLIQNGEANKASTTADPFGMTTRKARAIIQSLCPSGWKKRDVINKGDVFLNGQCRRER